MPSIKPLSIVPLTSPIAQNLEVVVNSCARGRVRFVFRTTSDTPWWVGVEIFKDAMTPELELHSYYIYGEYAGVIVRPSHLSSECPSSTHNSYLVSNSQSEYYRIYPPIRPSASKSSDLRKQLRPPGDLHAAAEMLTQCLSPMDQSLVEEMRSWQKRGPPALVGTSLQAILMGVDLVLGRQGLEAMLSPTSEWIAALLSFHPTLQNAKMDGLLLHSHLKAHNLLFNSTLPDFARLHNAAVLLLQWLRQVDQFMRWIRLKQSSELPLQPEVPPPASLPAPEIRPNRVIDNIHTVNSQMTELALEDERKSALSILVEPLDEFINVRPPSVVEEVVMLDDDYSFNSSGQWDRRRSHSSPPVAYSNNSINPSPPGTPGPQQAYFQSAHQNWNSTNPFKIPARPLSPSNIATNLSWKGIADDPTKMSRGSSLRSHDSLTVSSSSASDRDMRIVDVAVVDTNNNTRKEDIPMANRPPTPPLKPVNKQPPRVPIKPTSTKPNTGPPSRPPSAPPPLTRARSMTPSRTPPKVNNNVVPSYKLPPLRNQSAYDRLYHDGVRHNKLVLKLQQERELRSKQREQSQLQNCTFKPNIGSTPASGGSKPIWQRLYENKNNTSSPPQNEPNIIERRRSEVSASGVTRPIRPVMETKPSVLHAKPVESKVEPKRIVRSHSTGPTTISHNSTPTKAKKASKKAPARSSSPPRPAPPSRPSSRPPSKPISKPIPVKPKDNTHKYSYSPSPPTSISPTPALPSPISSLSTSSGDHSPERPTFVHESLPPIFHLDQNTSSHIVNNNSQAPSVPLPSPPSQNERHTVPLPPIVVPNHYPIATPEIIPSHPPVIEEIPYRAPSPSPPPPPSPPKPRPIIPRLRLIPLPEDVIREKRAREKLAKMDPPSSSSSESGSVRKSNTASDKATYDAIAAALSGSMGPPKASSSNKAHHYSKPKVPTPVEHGLPTKTSLGAGKYGYGFEVGAVVTGLSGQLNSYNSVTVNKPRPADFHMAAPQPNSSFHHTRPMDSKLFANKQPTAMFAGF